MTFIDQTGIRGKIRNRPISKELESLLVRAGSAAGIDGIYVTSGGQPGTTGATTGSTRHNGGRAADLRLVIDGKTLTFTNKDAPEAVKRFVTSAAAQGATGIGAGIGYMGPDTLHVGFGRYPSDPQKLVWGAEGRSRNSPKWLRDAATEGWNSPPDWAFETDGQAVEDRDEDDDEIFEEFEEDEAPMHIPERFSIDVIRAAQATQRRWGVPASVTLAQWAIESGYGKHMPSGSNNPFGIKARKDQPRVSAWTTEFIGGKSVKVQEPFRAFSSLEEAFMDHGRLLGSVGVYARARKFMGDADAFADALTGVYATDPNYGAKLKKIMHDNNLYAFNAPTIDGPPIEPDEMGNLDRPLQQGDVDLIRVSALQRRLTDLGYKLGKIDGKFGPLTAQALLAFQHENDLSTTGVLDRSTEMMLNIADRRRLDDARLTVTESDLVADGSRIAGDARKSRILSWLATAVGALGVGNSAIVNAQGATTVAGSPESLAQLLLGVQQLQPGANSDAIARLSTLAKALSDQMAATGGQAVSQGAPLRTILDILPSFFANDTVLQTMMKGVAAVGASSIPGFGGSLGVLALGLLGRHFANRIAATRVEDQRTAGNINPFS